MNITLNKSIDAYQNISQTQDSIKSPKQHLGATKSNKDDLTYSAISFDSMKKTPVQQALMNNSEPKNRKKGRPKQTWEATIVKDLIDIIPEMTNKLDSKTLEMLKEFASDREVWGRIVKRSMSSTRCMHTWNDH